MSNMSEIQFLWRMLLTCVFCAIVSRWVEITALDTYNKKYWRVAVAAAWLKVASLIGAFLAVVGLIWS